MYGLAAATAEPNRLQFKNNYRPCGRPVFPIRVFTPYDEYLTTNTHCTQQYIRVADIESNLVYSAIEEKKVVPIIDLNDDDGSDDDDSDNNLGDQYSHFGTVLATSESTGTVVWKYSDVRQPASSIPARVGKCALGDVQG